MYSVPAVSSFELRQRSLLQHVYAWMSGGLTITGLVAIYAYSSGLLERLLDISPGIMYGLILVEIVLVVALSFGINKMPTSLASGAFILYSILNGITMSVIFLQYTAVSIGVTFLVTAGMFGATSIYGYTTKRDLSSMGSFLMMALFGLILASIANMFVASSALYWVITYAGVAIFVALTAYDTQKIKEMSAVIDRENSNGMFQRVVILGALSLYLDFINMFWYLLRIFGSDD